MIKELIKDLAYDKATLNQALTVAKIIASKLDNSAFQDWIKKELNGYADEDPSLPFYRQMYCNIKGTIVDFYGYHKEVIPIVFDNEELKKMLNHHSFTQSISELETNYNSLTDETGLFDFMPEQVHMLEEMMQLRTRNRRRLIRAGREIPKLQLKRIIDLTKQKLLDTLLQLDKEFPNLEIDFTMNKENNDKVQNIITNNIYGNNNPVNVAAGNNVEQKDINNTLSNIDYSQLEKLGVNAAEVSELKEIVASSSQDKEGFKKKAMKWLGSVSSAVAGRGLYENIPAITEFIQGLI